MGHRHERSRRCHAVRLSLICSWRRKRTPSSERQRDGAGGTARLRHRGCPAKPRTSTPWHASAAHLLPALLGLNTNGAWQPAAAGQTMLVLAMAATGKPLLVLLDLVTELGRLGQANEATSVGASAMLRFLSHERSRSSKFPGPAFSQSQSSPASCLTHGNCLQLRHLPSSSPARLRRVQLSTATDSFRPCNSLAQPAE